MYETRTPYRALNPKLQAYGLKQSYWKPKKQMRPAIGTFGKNTHIVRASKRKSLALQGAFLGSPYMKDLSPLGHLPEGFLIIIYSPKY